MKTGYERRMDAAQAHEQHVMGLLQSRGWTVHEIGQGQMPRTVRTALKNVRPPCHLRWWPDIVAVRKMLDEWDIALVDAKAGRVDTGNYAVEDAARDADLAFIGAFRIPVYYVFMDDNVATPQDVQAYGRPGPFHGAGSGTPFSLLPKRFARPFDVIFAEVTEAA